MSKEKSLIIGVKKRRQLSDKEIEIEKIRKWVIVNNAQFIAERCYELRKENKILRRKALK
tara:strand:- start:31983 stop:32162 length:180 start_codon:yes stop_codon:yes gene_type:complete